MNNKQFARALHIGWRTLEMFISNGAITPPIEGMWTRAHLPRAASELANIIAFENQQRDILRGWKNTR
jgi:hypothetical protein